MPDVYVDQLDDRRTQWQSNGCSAVAGYGCWMAVRPGNSFGSNGRYDE
jgi:hypothetical protein